MIERTAEAIDCFGSSDSAAAMAYRDVARRLVEELEKRPRASMPIGAALL